MLTVENLSSGYGNLQVLRDVSFHVDGGEFVSLIGSNGAGKTTLLRTISGAIRQNGGSIMFNKQSMDPVAQDMRVQKGLVQVPEGRQLFSDMTVAENLDMGGVHARRQEGEEIQPGVLL